MRQTEDISRLKIAIRQQEKAIKITTMQLEKAKKALADAKLALKGTSK